MRAMFRQSRQAGDWPDWSDLPPNIFAAVLANVQHEDMAAVRLVCHRWKHLLDDNIKYVKPRQILCRVPRLVTMFPSFNSLQLTSASLEGCFCVGEFKRLTQLTELTITRVPSRIRGTSESRAKRAFRNLGQRMPELRRLTVANNPLFRGHCVTTLPAPERLLHADFRGSGVLYKAVQGLATRCTSLCHLDLSLCPIHRCPLPVLRGLTALTALALNSLATTASMDTVLDSAEVQGIASLRSLLALGLGKFPWLCETVLNEISTLPVLAILHLPSPPHDFAPGLDAAATQAALPGLGRLRTLRSLNLDYHPNSSPDYAFLSRLTRLTSLSLRGTMVHDDAIAGIVSMPDLYMLDLQSCPLLNDDHLLLIGARCRKLVRGFISDCQGLSIRGVLRFCMRQRLNEVPSLFERKPRRRVSVSSCLPYGRRSRGALKRNARGDGPHARSGVAARSNATPPAGGRALASACSDASAGAAVPDSPRATEAVELGAFAASAAAMANGRRARTSAAGHCSDASDAPQHAAPGLCHMPEAGSSAACCAVLESVFDRDLAGASRDAAASASWVAVDAAADPARQNSSRTFDAQGADHSAHTSAPSAPDAGDWRAGTLRAVSVGSGSRSPWPAPTAAAAARPEAAPIPPAGSAVPLRTRSIAAVAARAGVPAASSIAVAMPLTDPAGRPIAPAAGSSSVDGAATGQSIDVAAPGAWPGCSASAAAPVQPCVSLPMCSQLASSLEVDERTSTVCLCPSEQLAASVQLQQTVSNAEATASGQVPCSTPPDISYRVEQPGAPLLTEIVVASERTDSCPDSLAAAIKPSMAVPAPFHPPLPPFWTDLDATRRAHHARNATLNVSVFAGIDAATDAGSDSCAVPEDAASAPARSFETTSFCWETLQFAKHYPGDATMFSVLCAILVLLVPLVLLLAPVVGILMVVCLVSTLPLRMCYFAIAAMQRRGAYGVNEFA